LTTLRGTPLMLACLAGATLSAAAVVANLEGSFVLPLDHTAIRYADSGRRNVIDTLQKAMEEGQINLARDPERGYLPAVLNALEIPVSSQVLVFSKTSFQAPLISPANPRALYFNDEVSVGHVHDGHVLELAAVDPDAGVVFYTLNQQRSAPQLVRNDDCLQCHGTPNTLGVPGLIVRSVFPDRAGMPLFQAGSFVTDYRSPFEQRWGGWYVTGTHGTARHMGNQRSVDDAGTLAPETGANIKDLAPFFDTSLHLSPHSDIVALMVLEHQSRMTNLMTRFGWEVRVALAREPAGDTDLHRNLAIWAREFVDYLLFIDEAPLPGSPVQGASGFAEQFANLGPRDRQGRSLRDLDLQTRLLKYPCSYLIYSEQFDRLPEIARDAIARRMRQVLTGEDRQPKYSRLSPADRRAILEILRDTKTGLRLGN
jgi:hypothetical protein